MGQLGGNGLADRVDDDASALVPRMVVFAGFPLFAAVRLVRRQGLPLDRNSLRLPFYAQCHPIALFALDLNIGFSIARFFDPRFVPIAPAQRGE